MRGARCLCDEHASPQFFGRFFTGNDQPAPGSAATGVCVHGDPIQVEDTGCQINIDEDGTITIAATDAAKADEAKRRIEQLTAEVEIGKVYEGPVTKILDFGALINLLPGKDGLLHISQIAHERVEKVTDYLKEGQVVKVKVLETDEKGRVKLSMKALLDRNASAGEAAQQQQQ